MLIKIRFSVKALLVLVTLVAIVTGTFGVRLNRAHRQSKALGALLSMGASASYDHLGPIGARNFFDPFDDSPPPNSPWVSEFGPWKRWLGRQFGPDFVCDLKYVSSFRPLTADLVRRLRDIRHIESLYLNVGQEFTNEAWQELLKCRNVEQLTLDRYQFNPTRRLTGLSAWNQLRSLTVKGGEFSVADAQEVARLPNLRQLTLNLVATTDAALAPLAALKRLEVFELTHAGHGREVSNDGVAFLAELPKLRVLTLARMPPIDDAICAHLEKMPQLISLNLDQATVQGASFDRLAGLTNLKILNLIGTRVDDAALRKLSRLKQLEELDLGATRLTDAGLADVAALTNLRKLSLYSNKLTDAGIASLAELKQLNELGLTGTAVTDAGLQHLGGLAKLQTLWLGGQSKVAPQAVAELKKQLPGCNIYQH